MINAPLRFCSPIDSNAANDRPKNEKGIRDGKVGDGVPSLGDDRLIWTQQSLDLEMQRRARDTEGIDFTHFVPIDLERNDEVRSEAINAHRLP